MWYVHRVAGVIASAHRDLQPGYAEELVADDAGEMVAFLTPPAPISASAGDFMKALIQTGVYDAVDAAVNSLSGDQGKLAKVLWTRAAVIERNNPFVVQIATALGVNLDDLFILANSYN